MSPRRPDRGHEEALRGIAKGPPAGVVFEYRVHQFLRVINRSLFYTMPRTREKALFTMVAEPQTPGRAGCRPLYSNRKKIGLDTTAGYT